MINQLLQDLPSLDPSRIEDILVGNAVPEAEQGLQNSTVDFHSIKSSRDVVV